MLIYVYLYAYLYAYLLICINSFIAGKVFIFMFICLLIVAKVSIFMFICSFTSIHLLQVKFFIFHSL